MEHIEGNCKEKRRASSTPNPANNSPRLPPTPKSNKHISRIESNLSVLENNQTILTELLRSNQQEKNEAGLIKDRKDRLRRIKSFDGNIKGDCITWVDQNQSVAGELVPTITKSHDEYSRRKSVQCTVWPRNGKR